MNINIVVGFEHKGFLQILIMTHANGEIRHFARVGSFSSGLRMTDVGC